MRHTTKLLNVCLYFLNSRWKDMDYKQMEKYSVICWHHMKTLLKPPKYIKHFVYFEIYLFFEHFIDRCI